MLKNYIKNKNKLKIFKQSLKQLSKKDKKEFIYSFNIYDSYTIFQDENSGYEKFILVGDNWKYNDEKPIAVLFGFNDWKYGFISDYLKNFRCAFAPKSLNGLRAVYTIGKFKFNPKQFFVWGYTDSYFLNKYLLNKKVIRVEDGFIRSSSLGASHSTPYSLSFDSNGLYYNCYQESDLENILNNYDFKNDKILMDNTEKILDTILKLRISKYNPAIVKKNNILKFRKRVAILGQVANDSSLKYGNPHGITLDEMILLAKEENLDAEIIYRPHPEVYKGFQKNIFNKNFFDGIVNISTPEEDVLDLIDSVDHVYTITSLSGFEALLRGKKVTLLGAPFYAGWGLTDDRVIIERRNRKLNLLELLAGAYLLYPKYLGNLKDSFTGLMTACFKIQVDKDIEKYDYFTQKFKDKKYQDILENNYFVKLIFSGNQEEIENNFDRINFGTYLNESTSPNFEKIYIYSILGILKNEKLEDEFLGKVRSLIDYEVFHEILLMLNKFYEKDYLIDHIIWLKNQEVDFELNNELLDILNDNNPFEIIEKNLDKNNEDIFSILETKENDFELLFTKQENQSIENQIKNRFIDMIVNGEFKKINSAIKYIKNNDFLSKDLIEKSIKDKLFDYYEHYLTEKRFEDAIQIAKIMLLNDIKINLVFHRLVELLINTFDFNGAKQLIKLNQNINIYVNNKNLLVDDFNLISSKDIEEMGELKTIIKLVKLISLKPNTIFNLDFSQDRFSKIDTQFVKNICTSVLYLDSKNSIAKAMSFLSVGDIEKAYQNIQNIFCQKIKIDDNFMLCYYKILFEKNNEKLKAVEVLDNYINKSNSRNENLYRELIMGYLESGLFDKSFEILKYCDINKIKINPVFYMKVYQVIRNPHKAYSYFKLVDSTKNFKNFFKNKYIENYEESTIEDIITIFPIFGPGDEIRYAPLYVNFIKKIKYKELYICTTDKLYSLLSRTFNNINFVQVNRKRSVNDIFDEVENYNKLKSSSLVSILDNNGIELIEKSDKVSLVTSFISDFIKDYESFPKNILFAHDIKRTDEFKKILNLNAFIGKVVGINWRSSITNYSRNQHYLTIEEIECFFTIPNIQFINLQYDECSTELLWVEEKYPGKLLNVKELDQYNDLDGVASLIKCMDLVIAPCTTVGELSGALGTETWMFSNSHEMKWRKIDDGGTDVWFNSIKIIDVDPYIGNKKLLVEKLYNKLVQFSIDN